MNKDNHIDSLEKERKRLSEMLDELVHWSEDLRSKTKDAVFFWDDAVGDENQNDHPSNHLFNEFRHKMDVDGAIEEAKAILN